MKSKIIILSILLVLSSKDALGWLTHPDEQSNSSPMNKMEEDQGKDEGINADRRMTAPIIIEYNNKPIHKIGVLRKAKKQQVNYISNVPQNMVSKTANRRRRILEPNMRDTQTDDGYKNRRKRRLMMRDGKIRDAGSIRKRNLPVAINHPKEYERQNERITTVHKKKRVTTGYVAGKNQGRQAVLSMHEKRDAPENIQRVYPEKNKPKTIEQKRENKRMRDTKKQKIEEKQKARFLKNIGQQKNKYVVENPANNEHLPFQKVISSVNTKIHKKDFQNHNDLSDDSAKGVHYKLLNKLIPVPGRLHENQKQSLHTRQKPNNRQRSANDVIENNEKVLHSKRSIQLGATKKQTSKRNVSPLGKIKFLDASQDINTKDFEDVQETKHSLVNSDSVNKVSGKRSTYMDVTNQEIKNLENKATNILKKIEELREHMIRANEKRQKKRSNIINRASGKDIVKREKENKQRKRNTNEEAEIIVQKSLQTDETVDLNQHITKREEKERWNENNNLQKQQQIQTKAKDGFESSIERKKKHAKDIYKKFLSDNNKVIETENIIANLEEKGDFSNKPETEPEEEVDPLEDPENVQKDRMEEDVKDAQKRQLGGSENVEGSYFLNKDAEFNEPQTYDTVLEMVGWLEPEESDTLQIEIESLEPSGLDDEEIDMYIEMLKNIEIEDEEIERFIELLKYIELDDPYIETWVETLRKRQVGYKNLKEDFEILKQEVHDENLDRDTEILTEEIGEKVIEDNQNYKTETNENEDNNQKSAMSWKQSLNMDAVINEQSIKENSNEMKDNEERHTKNRKDKKKETEEKRKENEELKRQKVQDRKLRKQLVNKKNRVKQYEGDRLLNNTSTPPCSYEQRRGAKNLCGCKFPDTCVRVYECTAPHCSFIHTCMTPADARHICRSNSCKESETCYLVTKPANEFSAGCLLVNKTVVKPGRCPMLRNPYGSSGTHNESVACLTDSDCSQDRKCCQLKELGKKTCTDPVADVTKPGLCPPKEFLSLLSDHQLCQKDADCPQCLKCCKGETESHCYRPLSQYEAEKWQSLY